MDSRKSNASHMSHNEARPTTPQTKDCRITFMFAENAQEGNALRCALEKVKQDFVGTTMLRCR